MLLMLVFEDNTSGGVSLHKCCTMMHVAKSCLYVWKFHSTVTELKSIGNFSIIMLI